MTSRSPGAIAGALFGAASVTVDVNVLKALITQLDNPHNLEKFLAAFPSLDRRQVTGMISMAKRCSCMKD
jgi:hypothetical protein